MRKSDVTLDAFVRGYCEEVKAAEGGRPNTPRKRRPLRELPYLAIVLDTETLADDPSQCLTFGSYAVLTRSSDGLSYDPTPIEKAFFYADSTNVPHEFAVRLTECGRDAGGDVPIDVISQHDFLERFYELAVRDGALVVGFNLPFDLTKIACDATEARKSAKGGFSLILWANEAQVRSKRGHVPKGAYKRPRLVIKSLGPRKSSIAFSRSAHFIDAEQKLRYAMDAVDRATKRGRPYRWMLDGSAVPVYKTWARRLWAAESEQRAAIGATLVADFTAERFQFTNTGRFLDVSTLVSAITDRAYSLDGACKAFGTKVKGSTAEHVGWNITPDYVAYNWNDVTSTCELLDATLRSFAQHPIDLEPDAAYSAASIGKAYFRKFGITSPLDRWPDFPRDVLGIAASSFYGGSTGVGYRRCIVPVKYVDFLSMYSTVNALLGTEELLRAADYRVVDCTDDINEMLATMPRRAAFDRDFWKRLSFFGEVILDGSGVFPVRSVFEKGDAARIGMCYAKSDDPRWYAGPDVVASYVLSGKRPRVRRAIRIEPVRDAPGVVVPLASLTSVDLLGSVPVNPATDNIFQRLIEERVRAKGDAALSKAERDRLNTGLKCIASATGYGVFAEVNVDDTGEQREMRVYSAGETFEAINDFERAGAFSFMPIAAFITSAAHLMLALVEREVKRRGGTIAAWDTDSSAIVATKDGGWIDVIADGGGTKRVRALSWHEVEAIVGAFQTLNPYDRGIVRGSILKIEEINFDSSGALRDVWMYAVSSKRYCMFEIVDGEPEFIVDESGKVDGVKESALGAIVGPVFCDRYDPRTSEPVDAAVPEAKKTVWIPRFWNIIVRRAMGLPDRETAWLGQHVVGNFKLSSAFVWKQFATINRGRPYAESIKPHGFGITLRFESPYKSRTPPRIYGAKIPRARMFPSDVPETPFFDTATGDRYVPALSLAPGAEAYGDMALMTFADLAATYAQHPESKVALRDGRPCDSMEQGYAGPLYRRHVRLGDRVVVGKESTVFGDEIAQALGGDPEARTHVTLSGIRDESLRIVDVLPTRFAGGHSERRERIAKAIRDGRAGRNATTVAIERHLVERARKPGAFEAMLAKRRRDRKAEARARGDAAFAHAFAERERWRSVIASRGGIIADEINVGSRWTRDPQFDVVPRRYRSTQRAEWIAGDSRRRGGNLSQIIALLAAVGIATNGAGVLAWCSANLHPTRSAYRLKAKLEVEAECEAEVRQLLRSRNIRIAEPTKAQRNVNYRKLKREAARKRNRRATAFEDSSG